MTRTDDLGRPLTLALPARRIVSLSPATTENLFAVGAGGSIVGGTSACDFPEAAKKLPRIGDFTRPSYERIVSLKPDLLVFDSATVRKGDVEALAARLRVPIFVQCTRKVDDIPRHLADLAALSGQTFSTNPLREALKPRTVLGPRPRVFIQIGLSPLCAVGPGSFIDDLIQRVGGQNAVTTGEQFPLLTREQLAALKPDVYIIAVTPGVKEAPPLVTTPKVGRILADLLFRPTPRLAQAFGALHQILAAK